MSIQNMKIDIENLVNRICRGVTGGELRQLGALFTPSFLDELSKIIYSNECIKHPGLVINVYSELCWIDKAPYAKLCKGIPFTNKVELGDAMFIFDEKLLKANSHIILQERKKAFILQAKVIEKEAGICNVPIAKYDQHKKDSTYKEFELYRKWADFDIYYASNTNKIEESNIKLINGSSIDPCRFAWYGVAASTRNPNSSTNWPCRWMVGKAVMNSPCDITIGELLSGFYNNYSISGSQVGEYFEGVNNYNPDWERVVHHVRVRSNQLGKPSYFPANVKTLNRIIFSNKKFIAPQLVQLFSAFGLNGQKITRKLLNYLYLYPHCSLGYLVRKVLRNNLPHRYNRTLLNGVLNILQSPTPIMLRLTGNYKPKKFPIISVTVKRQEVEKFYIDNMS